MQSSAIERALISLEGLSVGDAFGEQFFTLPPSWLETRRLPPSPWPWTDDTHMALSVVEVLRGRGQIHQDTLAAAFARRFDEEPYRGYAGGAVALLNSLLRGESWQAAAPHLFDGGSYGNGAAMRAAPIGAFFGGDPGRAAAEAQLSAAVTHAHPEGQAGAMAVAAASALAADPGRPAGRDFIAALLPYVPQGLTRAGIERAVAIPGDALAEAAGQLGTGRQVAAHDTVPFCLWSAAFHLDDFEEAMWWTVQGRGDRDTTCAIVGGIVALVTPPSGEWVDRREPLPRDFLPSWD